MFPRSLRAPWPSYGAHLAPPPNHLPSGISTEIVMILTEEAMYLMYINFEEQCLTSYERIPLAHLCQVEVGQLPVKELRTLKLAKLRRDKRNGVPAIRVLIQVCHWPGSAPSAALHTGWTLGVKRTADWFLLFNFSFFPSFFLPSHRWKRTPSHARTSTRFQRYAPRCSPSMQPHGAAPPTYPLLALALM